MGHIPVVYVPPKQPVLKEQSALSSSREGYWTRGVSDAAVLPPNRPSGASLSACVKIVFLQQQNSEDDSVRKKEDETLKHRPSAFD